MEYGAYALAAATFALVIYVITTMPTKKDLRRIERRSESREEELRSVLRDRIGLECELILSETGFTAGGTHLSGTIQDVDDEWVLVECRDKKGATQMKVLRIALVEGVESS